MCPCFAISNTLPLCRSFYPIGNLPVAVSSRSISIGTLSKIFYAFRQKNIKPVSKIIEFTGSIKMDKFILAFIKIAYIMIFVNMI